jgi:hypothetical protein
MAERNLSIRLSVKDQDTVKRALEALGKDGQAALRRIEEGAKPASGGLKAVNAASQEVQSGLAGLAGRAGPVGSVLSAIGPAGMVAAAGIGAVTIGIGFAIARARQAVESFSDVAKTADRLGVTTTALQELRYAADRVGIGAESADEALKELGIRAAEAADGTGEGAEGFKKLGISQDEVKAKLKDLPGLFQLVASRISQVKTSAEQAYIADKIFGDQGGEKLVALLKQGADGLARFRAEAQSLGVVVEESVLRRATATKAELDSLSRVIDLNLNQAFVDLAPSIVAATQLAADFAKWIRVAADGYKDFGQIGQQRVMYELAQIDERLNALNAKARDWADKRAQGGLAGTDAQLGAWTKSVFGQSLEEEIRDLERQRAQFQARLDLLRGPPESTGSPVVTPWGGQPSDDYVDPNADPVKDAKAQFRRAVQSFEFESDKWDKERATRDSLDQTARELMEYANKLREPQRKMLEDQAADVRRIIEANTRAQVQNITRVGDAIDRSLQENLQRSAAGFQSWGDSVRAIIMDVANELIRMYMVQSTGGGIGSWIAQGINAWVGSMGAGQTPGKVMEGNTSGAGYFGSRDFGGLTTAGGPRAAGGQVFPDTLYMVNERRAEDSSAPGFFMPIRPGMIAPESTGGSSGVALNQNFNLSVSGGTAAEIQQLRAIVADMQSTFGQRTVAALAEAKRTGKLRSIGV